MKLLAKILIAVLFIITLGSAIYFYIFIGNKETHVKNTINLNRNKLVISQIHNKGMLAKQFAKKHNMSLQYCFMINMSEPSGKDRFYVYDFKGDSVVALGLVAHGCGNESFAGTAKFSNTPNSNCTAIGHYRIGGKYKGRFGDAWKLIGLDSSNNKSFDRNIVLHAYGCVPDKAPYPLPICNSRGCPMVSYTFMNILKSFIEDADKPVLLWIYI